MHSNIHLIHAANAAQRIREEGEEMLVYTSEDLNNDWEFKIVRSGSAVFRKPEILQQLLQEEARAGWVMLEKLDDARVRFKRRRSASAMDLNLPPDFDPYRTIFHHPAATKSVVFMIIFIIGLILLMVLLPSLLMW